MKRPNFTDLVIYEDDHFLLINKPPYISTLKDRHESFDLLSLAREIGPNLQAGHRLDKETSGVLAFTKSPEAYRHLSRQFENRKVSKTYHAIVDGIHDFKAVKIEAPIKALSMGKVKIDWEEGKPSTTVFETLEAFPYHSLVQCSPLTGRMHQIRIHLTYLKAPITGDAEYGGKPLMLSKLKRSFNLKKWTEELPLIKRVALHAYELKFESLEPGKYIEAQAPYPKDFAVALKQLRKFSSP